MKRQLAVVGLFMVATMCMAIGCGNLGPMQPQLSASLAPTDTPSAPTSTPTNTATSTPTGGGIPVTVYVKDSNPGTASTGGTWTITNGATTLVQMNETQLYSGATTIVYLTAGVTYYSTNTEAISSVCVTCAGGPITQTLPQTMAMWQPGASGVVTGGTDFICGPTCRESQLVFVAGTPGVISSY